MGKTKPKTKVGKNQNNITNLDLDLYSTKGKDLLFLVSLSIRDRNTGLLSYYQTTLRVEITYGKQ